MEGAAITGQNFLSSIPQLPEERSEVHVVLNVPHQSSIVTSVPELPEGSSKPLDEARDVSNVPQQSSMEEIRALMQELRQDQERVTNLPAVNGDRGTPSSILETVEKGKEKWKSEIAAEGKSGSKGVRCFCQCCFG